MLTISVALVSEVEGHDPGDIARVSAALQRQALRDFRRFWHVEATVDHFPSLEDVPLGYWPMIVKDNIGFPGAAGIHLDKDGQPFALITMSDSWSLTASHELLEMCADPVGNRVVPGKSPKPGQGRVEFLVEVCDPSEGEDFGYTVNDILVSDFYLPRFFDPVAIPGLRYSFTGAIRAPRTILKGGYISFHDPISDHWWQERWFGTPQPTFSDLGVFDARANESVRVWVDTETPLPTVYEGLESSNAKLQAAVELGESTRTSAAAKAASWREQIGAILGGSA